MVLAASCSTPYIHLLSVLCYKTSYLFISPVPCQVTDYAIARRIVDLHCRSEASVDRTYSLEEVQRYILFARQFRPKMNKVR